MVISGAAADAASSEPSQLQGASQEQAGGDQNLLCEAIGRYFRARRPGGSFVRGSPGAG
jgi:hypothetical protein